MKLNKGSKRIKARITCISNKFKIKKYVIQKIFNYLVVQTMETFNFANNFKYNIITKKMIRYIDNFFCKTAHQINIKG